MDVLLQTIVVGVMVIYGLTFIYAGLRYKLTGVRLAWLGVLALLAALANGTYLLDEDFAVGNIGRGALLISLNIGLMGVAGALALSNITPPRRRQSRMIVWSVGVGVWLVGFLVAVLVTPDAIAGSPEWLIRSFTAIDASVWVVIVGYVAATLVMTVYNFWRFYRAGLPEIANRTLFWIVIIGLLFFSVFISSSGTLVVAVLTMPLTAVTIVGMAYAMRYHHVFDVRLTISYSLRVLVSILLGAGMTATALLLALNAEPQDDAERFTLVVVLASAIAVVYVVIRQLIETVLRWLASRTTQDTAYITREYSQLVSEVVELDALVPSSTATMNRLLAVKSSCIVLLSQTSEVAIDFLVMHPDSPTDKRRGRLAVSSPLYMTLAKQRTPLLQFDIEFDPQYAEIPANERDFFRSLGMSAYAPITLDYTMTGILAVGPKLNDTAYYSSDLELLATLAQQTGIALRNARLLEDLQHLNKSMRNLNQKLKSSNEQLSRMDSVKSDFVTIASHELRTPLAQIRGYTDIMDALNEQGMLDPDQTNNIIGNLRKATERMEELISAMLDVSQLDIEAMDLRFAQTSIESLVKMAIEPLTDAIRQRKLTLSARGLRGLPNVQADLQRLVQAFRNVIVNSIKFTPDGGKIDIMASLEQAKSEDDVDHILIQIRDTGVGIDRANLEMIFKKFFRAYDPSLHSTGSYKFLGAGPGLGLTITRGVIEGHGGRIWAESPGHDMEAFPGATFNIVLPVSTPEGARRVLTFEGTTANDVIGRTPEMQKNTSMRKPERAGDTDKLKPQPTEESV